MYAIIFGTRPEYLKVKSIIEEFQKQDILKYKIIYIQQHTSIKEPIIFSYEILPIFDDYSHDRLFSLGSQILVKLPKYINECSHIIVQGDTATAFYSSLVAFQLQKIIVHIEAGLRTYDLDKPFPEEGYRQMISRITHIHFTPHDESNIILKNEKINENIFCVGNTILDVVKSYNIECCMNNTVLITFHRRENWDKIDVLLDGIKKLIKKTPHIQYIWYLHPNPILQEKVKTYIKNSNIISVELRESCSHKEFTEQIANANFIITDSGGIQEEASFLGKHCIVLRTSTERSHIPKEYITILEDYSKLDEVYKHIPKTSLPSCNVYGYGESAKNILQIIQTLK